MCGLGSITCVACFLWLFCRPPPLPSIVTQSKKHIVMFDSAYQGFASGGMSVCVRALACRCLRRFVCVWVCAHTLQSQYLTFFKTDAHVPVFLFPAHTHTHIHTHTDAEKDAAAVRYFVEEGHDIMLVQSFAKVHRHTHTLSHTANTWHDVFAVLRQNRHSHNHIDILSLPHAHTHAYSCFIAQTWCMCTCDDKMHTHVRMMLVRRGRHTHTLEVDTHTLSR